LGSCKPALVAEVPTEGQTPRLAVLVVFDQLRGDYLSRWQGLFGPGGFRRLQTEGAWFSNCHYPYAATLTGPGHASILTGCSPPDHGIIANEWYDRAAGEKVGCVEVGRYERVPSRGLAQAGAAAQKEKGNVSPERLLAPTLGDALKNATGGKGRIVSLSMKDRSAVLPAGRRADACYWFDSNTGEFVTSTYYRDRLPSWVAEFNRARPADQWFGKDWQRLRPDLDYVRYSGVDDAPGEGRGFAQGRTFPHPMTGGQFRPGPKYYNAVFTSPFGDELLLNLTFRALAAEHLRSKTPDLLCVSFSCTDAVGHCWGPDSQEVLDTILRADIIVRKLLDYLDGKVGRGRYLLALTADHGVCPLPELARNQGQEAGRISPKLLLANAERFLDQKFGRIGRPARWLVAREETWLYLNQGLLRERGLQSAEVEESLAGWLRQQPGILAAYTRTQLAGGLPRGDSLGESVRRSFHPERSGDVVFVLKPYHLLTETLATGTLHGTPHSYDTHVPLLVFGPDVIAGLHSEPVTPQAIAAILARALEIEPPACAQAPVPAGLFTSR
jgi:hypothetical protein